MSLDAYAAEYSSLDDQVTRAEEDLKKLKQQRDDAEMALFREMAEVGIPSFKSSALKKMFIAGTKKYPRLADKSREEEMHAWLEENGYGGVIRRAVHASTLKATLKELIDDKGVTPPEFIEVYEQVGVSIRSAR